MELHDGPLTGGRRWRPARRTPTQPFGVTQRALSVTQRALSATQRALNPHLEGVVAGQVAVLGLLRTGTKKLFVTHLGQWREIEPMCVLDFYVHESCQVRAAPQLSDPTRVLRPSRAFGCH